MKRLIAVLVILLILATALFVAIFIELTDKKVARPKTEISIEEEVVEITRDKKDKIEEYVRYNLKILEIEDVHEIVYPGLKKAISEGNTKEEQLEIINDHVRKGIVKASLGKIDEEYKRYSDQIEYDFFEEILDEVNFEEMIDFMIRYEYQILKDENLLQ
jgi:hypothetical protein